MGPGSTGRRGILGPSRGTTPFFREEPQGRVAMPGDGPNGPPIAGAPGGGPSLFAVLGTKKVVLVALAGVLVGALAALIPRYLL